MSRRRGTACAAATLVPDFTKTRPAVPLVAGYVPDVTYDTGTAAALGSVLSGPDTTLGLPPLKPGDRDVPRCVPVSVEVIRPCHDRPRRTSGLHDVRLLRAGCLGTGALKSAGTHHGERDREPSGRGAANSGDQQVCASSVGDGTHAGRSANAVVPAAPPLSEGT